MSEFQENEFDRNDLESNDIRKENEIALQADMIISNLLQDLLGDHDCPGFHSQIQDRLEILCETQHSTVSVQDFESSSAISSSAISSSVIALFTESEHLSATNFALREHQGGAYVIPPTIVIGSNKNYQAEPDLAAWIRRASFLVAALAAALVGVLLYPVLSPTKIANDPVKGSSANLQFEEPKALLVEASESNGNQSEASVPSSMMANGEMNASTIPTIASENGLEKLEQSKVATQVLGPNDVNTQRVKRSGSEPIRQGSLQDKDMVAIIDGQLKHLWERLGIEPMNDIKTEAWLERSTETIVGRLPTAAEKEAFRISKGSKKNLEFVDRLISSDEFSRKWSFVLANHYLGRSSSGLDSKQSTVAEKVFVSWLSQSLSKHTFTGELEREMMTGPRDEIASDVTSESGGALIRTDPASYLLTEWFAQSDKEKHDLENTSGGVSKRQKDKSFVSASRQLMRIVGNNATVCSQCHEGDSHSNGIESFLASTVSNRGTEPFWSVSANLTPFSIERRGQAGSFLKVGKYDDLFVEDMEGRMKVIQPLIATRDTGKAFTQALGDWLSSSVEARKSLVDSIWNEVFGQPLVPMLGLTDKEGLPERVQLRDLLAKQMQQDQTDLGTVVRWLVLSNAFRAETPKVDTPWYLKATESQLADVQNQLKLFAASSISKAEAIAPGQDNTTSLALLAGWVEANRMDELNNNALAQPSISLPAANQESIKKNKLVFSEAQIRFFMSSKEPYDQVALFAERIGQSSMNFPKMVDHAFLATQSRFPTVDERELATKVYEISNRNAVNALTMLVNAQMQGK